jgi:hypothetical protein
VGDRGVGKLSRAARIAALAAPILLLSVLLSLLVCATADAITLPGHAGQCPQLAIGSTDKQCVAALQRLLNSENVRPPLKINGIYDTPTFNNVKKFQDSRKLNPDGIVGPDTAGALGLSWENSQAKNRKTAARASSSRAAASGNGGPAAATSSVSRIISVQAIIAIGIFITVAVAIMLFAKRLRHVNISITKRITIFLELAPTDTENKLEALRHLVRLWEATAAYSEADAYIQVAEFLNEALLTEKINEKPRGIRFRKPRKMIEGRVEQDDDDWGP